MIALFTMYFMQMSDFVQNLFILPLGVVVMLKSMIVAELSELFLNFHFCTWS